jgi:DNA-directed RNA polymerase subunit RPC12/RpoP
MSEGDLIELGCNRHEIQCPHCQKQTVRNWPGNMILFATATCTHCGRKFLIALNEPQPVS